MQPKKFPPRSLAKPTGGNRYVKETGRLYGVLVGVASPLENRQLANQDYIAGDYSIADMACYPWIVPHEKQHQNLADFPNLHSWFDRMQSRPAVIRSYDRAKVTSN